MVDTVDQRETDAGLREEFDLVEHRGTIAFVTIEVLLFALAWATLAAFDGELANVLYGMLLSVGILGGVLALLAWTLTTLSRR